MCASGIRVFETHNLLQKRSTRQILSRNHPDRIRIAFDGHRLAANAGLSCLPPWPGTWAFLHLVDQRPDLGPAPARAHAGDKLMMPVASTPLFRRGRLWPEAAGSTPPMVRLREGRATTARGAGWRARRRRPQAVHSGCCLPVPVRPSPTVPRNPRTSMR